MDLKKLSDAGLPNHLQLCHLQCFRWEQIVAEQDPDQPITSVMSMDSVFIEATGEPQFYSQMLSVFAVVAVFLAAIGIYGVMSYFVSRRTHDIGIRMALGAHPKDILRWVCLLGFKLVAIGAVIGVALAIGLTRLISAVLFGVSSTNPATYFVVGLVLMAIALLSPAIFRRDVRPRSIPS